MFERVPSQNDARTSNWFTKLSVNPDLLDWQEQKKVFQRQKTARQAANWDPKHQAAFQYSYVPEIDCKTKVIQLKVYTRVENYKFIANVSPLLRNTKVTLRNLAPQAIYRANGLGRR